MSEKSMVIPKKNEQSKNKKKKKSVVSQKKKLIAEKANKSNTITKINPVAHPFEYMKLNKRLKQIDKELAELGYTTRPTTAQRTIAYEMMYNNGICKVKGNFYNKMLEFSDLSYDLLEGEDKTGVLEEYSTFINFFDPTISFNMFLFNRKINENTLKNQFIITMRFLPVKYFRAPSVRLLYSFSVLLSVFSAVLPSGSSSPSSGASPSSGSGGSGTGIFA